MSVNIDKFLHFFKIVDTTTEKENEKEKLLAKIAQCRVVEIFKNYNNSIAREIHIIQKNFAANRNKF